jgi:hypothetical protein
MKILNFKKLTSPDIGELSENEDILIRKDDCNDYRVLVKFKDYQTLTSLQNLSDHRRQMRQKNQRA